MSDEKPKAIWFRLPLWVCRWNPFRSPVKQLAPSKGPSIVASVYGEA